MGQEDEDCHQLYRVLIQIVTVELKNGVNGVEASDHSHMIENFGE